MKISVQMKGYTTIDRENESSSNSAGKESNAHYMSLGYLKESAQTLRAHK